MNYISSLHEFFNSFDIPAYPEDNVPDHAIFPWLTYEHHKGGWAETTETVAHLHYYTESSAIPNNKCEEICKGLRQGMVISCDEGRIVLTTNNPEWQETPDQTDNMHKHRLINISMLWLLTT